LIKLCAVHTHRRNSWTDLGCGTLLCSGFGGGLSLEHAFVSGEIQGTRDWFNQRPAPRRPLRAPLAGRPPVTSGRAPQPPPARMDAREYSAPSPGTERRCGVVDDPRPRRPHRLVLYSDVDRLHRQAVLQGHAEIMQGSRATFHWTLPTQDSAACRTFTV
jgi:hypothetical protein